MPSSIWGRKANFWQRIVCRMLFSVLGKEEINSIPCTRSRLFFTWQIKNDIISIHRKNSARERYVRELEDVSCFANSVIDQEAQTLLYSAIEELPEKARIVFEMSFIEGLKNVEIAEKLGLSDSSVKKYKATALDFLRKKLEPSLFLFLFSGL